MNRHQSITILLYIDINRLLLLSFRSLLRELQEHWEWELEEQAMLIPLYNWTVLSEVLLISIYII